MFSRLKITFIRTKVKYFLACLTPKALNKFYKITGTWGCIELGVFLVSKANVTESCGDDREGHGRK